MSKNQNNLQSLAPGATGGLTASVLTCASIVAVAVSAGGKPVAAEEPVGTAFTYQGQLQQGGNPVDDTCDFAFELMDDPVAGSPLGPTLAKTVVITDGQFTELLDFGVGAFSGEARWLQIKVCCSSPCFPQYTTLSPRQELTPIPYALHAANAPDGHSLDAADGDPVDVIFVNSGGIVGVGNYGTFSPNVKMEVAGRLQVSDTSGNEGATFKKESNWLAIRGAGATHGSIFIGNDTTDLSVQIRTRTNTSATSVQIQKPGGSAIATFLGNGNVGIGITTDPLAKLHIGGTPGVDGIMFPDGTLQTTADTGDSTWQSSGSDIYYNDGNVGIGTTPNCKLDVAGNGCFEISATTGKAVYGWASDGSGGAYGVHGRSDGIGGRGVFGDATAGTGINYGVYGRSASVNGVGVYGLVTSLTGLSHGIWGWSYSDSGTGVFGVTDSPTGTTYGGYFTSASDEGYGVYGTATADTGYTFGVYGQSSSENGKGVFGTASHQSGATSGGYFTNPSTAGTGVYGQAGSLSGTTYGGRFEVFSGDGYGVHGQGKNHGVFGKATATAGTNEGVYGESGSPDGRGVFGKATANSGAAYGVSGKSNSASGAGVYGTAPVTGIFGEASNTSGITHGVHGQTSSSSAGAAGVFGQSSSGNTYGVYGQTDSGWTESAGVFGEATDTSNITYGVLGKGQTGVVGYGTASGFTYGVIGRSTSTQGRGVYGFTQATSGVTYALYGQTQSPDGYGVVSSGDVLIGGDLTVTGSKGGYITDLVINGGQEPLECGDVVEIVGHDEPLVGEIPLIVVRKAGVASSKAVLGPIDCPVRVLEDPGVGEFENAQAVLSHKPALHVHRGEGSIAPGGYGRVVTLGSFKVINVDASFGPIQPGDLLVSSPNPGYAMAAEDPKTGTVIGKALGSLDSATGQVPVLVGSR